MFDIRRVIVIIGLLVATLAPASSVAAPAWDTTTEPAQATICSRWPWLPGCRG